MPRKKMLHYLSILTCLVCGLVYGVSGQTGSAECRHNDYRGHLCNRVTKKDCEKEFIQLKCRGTCSNYGIDIECKDHKTEAWCLNNFVDRNRCDNRRVSWKCLKSCKKCCEITTTSPTPTSTTPGWPGWTPVGGCGMTTVKSRANRIIGGEDAEYGEIPYMANLKTNNTVYPFCGASIISNYWVITAAHCVTDSDKDEYKVVVGDHDLNVTEEWEKVLEIDSVYIHDDYSEVTFENDIALLKVKRPILYNRYINNICLEDELASDVLELTVSGWGEMAEAGIDPTILQKVVVPIVPTLNCTGHGAAYRPDEIYSTMFCAAGTIGKDSCRGDGGGPAVAIQNGRFVLVGIVSWGYYCAGYRSPGIYTRVTEFNQWINDKMNENP